MHKSKINYDTKTDFQLVELAKLDDDEARNTLVMRHTNLIHYIIHKYRIKSREDREDLFQECIIIFLKSINKFKFGYNVKVTSYIAWWIHAHIRKLKKESIENESFLIDTDISDSEEAMNSHYGCSPSIDFVNVLSAEERQLVDFLFEQKLSLTNIAERTNTTMGQVFSKKEKLLKRLRKIIRNDNNFTERAAAIK